MAAALARFPCKIDLIFVGLPDSIKVIIIKLKRVMQKIITLMNSYLCTSLKRKHLNIKGYPVN